jgi:hypothetical protein
MHRATAIVCLMTGFYVKLAVAGRVGLVPRLRSGGDTRNEIWPTYR